MGNYYNILGISENASAEEIKRSYRRLVKKYHPDSSGTHDTSSRFHQIQRAYKTLSDPAKRHHYDKGLEYIQTKRSKSQSQNAEPRARKEDYNANALRRWQKYVARLREDQNYYLSFRKYHRGVVYASLFLVFVFFGDAISVFPSATETVLSTHYLPNLTKNQGDADFFLVRTDKNIYKVPYDLASPLEPADEIVIRRSYFLGIFTCIEITRGDLYFSMSNGRHGAAKGFITALLLMSILTSLMNKKSEQMVNATLFCSLVLAINFLMLLGLIF